MDTCCIVCFKKNQTPNSVKWAVKKCTQEPKCMLCSACWFDNTCEHCGPPLNKPKALKRTVRPTEKVLNSEALENQSPDPTAATSRRKISDSPGTKQLQTPHEGRDPDETVSYSRQLLLCSLYFHNAICRFQIIFVTTHPTLYSLKQKTGDRPALFPFLVQAEEEAEEEEEEEEEKFIVKSCIRMGGNSI